LVFYAIKETLAIKKSKWYEMHNLDSFFDEFGTILL
jgi:hypothetical protein